MWGCSFFSNFSGMHGVFPLLAGGLILLVLVAIIIKLFGGINSNLHGRNQDRDDSLEILKTRFARGDINREEYLMMQEILLKQ